MASYIESSLGRSERIVYKAQVSWLSQFGRLVFGALFALLIREIPIIGIIGILFIIVAVLNVMTTELALTNKKTDRQSWLYPSANNRIKYRSR